MTTPDVHLLTRSPWRSPLALISVTVIAAWVLIAVLAPLLADRKSVV